MATNVSVILKFSDGTMTYLRDDVTENTLTEVQTDASGILNITANVSAGQFAQGKICIAAVAKVQTDNATTGAFGYAAFYGPQGNVLGAIQGGGMAVSGVPLLKRPIRMTTGIQVKVFWQAVADAVQYASLAVYCASGKTDIYNVLAVDGVATSILNKDGNSLGESLVGENVLCGYATYSASNGLADTGIADGIGAFYVEDSNGQLVAMFPPSQGAHHSGDPVPWIEQPFRVNQNMTLTVTANV